MKTAIVNNSKPVFLTAAWRKLVMANYIVDPAILTGYLPLHTDIDLFNGKCYISLVGFQFDDVKLKGIRIPFHHSFPEVNLRFYVRTKEKEPKRGVVFISEIVPKHAIAWIANAFYQEHYTATAMQKEWDISHDSLNISYRWKNNGRWNSLSVLANNTAMPIIQNSEEAFIYEHYFGYAKAGAAVTNEYEVQHPSWDVYPVHQYTIDCDFEKQYGKTFALLNQQEPASVLLAEGSAVSILGKNKLT